MLLEIRDLTFQVDRRRILDGLRFALDDGEIHALLGSNGAGKTTLAFLVMGCDGYTPTTGEIIFAGRPVGHLKLHERARLGITLTWQEPARFEGISVRDFLSLGNAAMDPGDSLCRVGLDPDAYLDRMADRTLSGGQRKRIELASVLALRPRLAILDEPTSGIDLLSMQEIIEVIHAFKQGGTSVLLITHMEEVAQIADRASELHAGKIAFTGAPEATVEHYKARLRHQHDGRERIGAGAR